MTSRATFDAARAGRADTIVSRFLDRAARDPERNVYTLFPLGALNSLGTLNWGDWATRARAFAGALLARRADKGARVAIYSSNRELWPVAALGAAMAGAVWVALSPDAERSALLEQLRDSDPAVVVVDTLARLKVLRSVQAELQLPFVIVCDDVEPLRSSTAEGLFEWETWLRDGALALQQYEPLRARLAERIEAVAAHDAAGIFYKAGTALGVVHSHASVVGSAAAIADHLGISDDTRLCVERSFSNPFENIIGIQLPIYAGAAGALVEHESDALLAAQLHHSSVLCGSESILDELNHKLSGSRMKHENLRDAVIPLVGEHCRTLLFMSDGVETGAGTDLQNAGIVLASVYGIPEQVCICRNGPEHWQPDSAGEPFRNVQVRLSAVGELEVRCSNLTSVGYFRRDEAFKARLTGDGAWLKTGVRFEQVNDHSLRVTGHMDDIITLRNGAAANALELEAELCALPHVAHAVCHGTPDQSLVAVLSLRRREVEAWALKQGIVAPWAALVYHPIVYDELSRGVAAVNASREHHERVTAFAPTDLEFSVHTGELDVRGQLHRPTVLARFEHVFADLQNRPHH